MPNQVVLGDDNEEHTPVHITYCLEPREELQNCIAQKRGLHGCEKLLQKYHQCIHNHLSTEEDAVVTSPKQTEN